MEGKDVQTRNNNLVRPSSATLKRKDPSKKSEDLT
jgi:hypothetical protein